MANLIEIPDGSIDWGSAMRTNLEALNTEVSTALTKASAAVSMAASRVKSVNSVFPDEAGNVNVAVSAVDQTARNAAAAAQSTADGKYTKPAQGIPTSDLAPAARTPYTPVQAFGAVGDGVVDDTAALRTAIAAGVPLYWGGPERTYNVSGMLSVTLSQHLNWYSAGAKVVVTSAAPILRVFSIDSAGYSVHIEGPLIVDAARNAFTGWYVTSSSTTAANFYAKNLTVRNVYRSSTSLTGGDGIHVRGNYTNVFLERPDVRSVLMAAGAGISGSQGVSGITVSSAGAGLAPGEITILHPYVDGVFCEDATYLMDQDGIRLFTEEDNGAVTLFDTHFSIIGGTVKNAHGRAVKSQCEFGNITNLKIVRNTSGAAPMAGQGGMPEIDFQVGGGIVQGVEFRYQSASAPTIIQASGTRQSGGKYSTSLQVRGLKGSVSGGTGALVGSVVKINMYEQVKMSVDLTDIELVNLGYYITGNLVELVPTYTTSELILRLINVSVPMNTGQYVFYRTGTVVTPVFLSVMNVANARSQTTASISGAATAGSLTVVTAGQQIRVS